MIPIIISPGAGADLGLITVAVAAEVQPQQSPTLATPSVTQRPDSAALERRQIPRTATAPLPPASNNRQLRQRPQPQPLARLSVRLTRTRLLPLPKGKQRCHQVMRTSIVTTVRFRVWPRLRPPAMALLRSTQRQRPPWRCRLPQAARLPLNSSRKMLMALGNIG